LEKLTVEGRILLNVDYVKETGCECVKWTYWLRIGSSGWLLKKAVTFGIPSNAGNFFTSCH
jgi:hypothetical protein